MALREACMQKKKNVYLAIIKSSVELYGREIRKSLKKV